MFNEYDEITSSEDTEHKKWYEGQNLHQGEQLSEFGLS